MKEKKKNKSRWIWLAVLLLFVGVAVTTLVVSDRLNLFQQDEKGDIIDLLPQTGTIPGEKAGEDGNRGENDDADSGKENAGSAQQGGASQNGDTSADGETGFVQTDPSFKVTDGTGTGWTKTTQVQIFSMNYENGESQITVRSDDQDKLIAPGTEQSYTFKLLNTGDVPLDYSVEVDAYFTPADVVIPITARLSRYDGEWLAGSLNSYAEISELDMAEDSNTVGVGKYVYYTLDWLWPFEGDDELDTLLGYRAVGEDLTFTINISTIAIENTTGAQGIGILPPKTGDDANLTLFAGLAMGAALIALLLLIFMIKEKREAKKQS